MQRYLDLFKGDESKKLELSYGGKILSNDEFVSRTEAEKAPELSFAAASSSSRYIAISLDNEAPFPSFNFLSPILHSIQTDLKISSPSNKVLTSDAPEPVNWTPPNPPPGSSPHRYVFLLYEQPSGFNSKDVAASEPGKPVGLWQRIRWNLAAWEKKANVGQPVAVGYFKSN